MRQGNSLKLHLSNTYSYFFNRESLEFLKLTKNRIKLWHYIKIKIESSPELSGVLIHWNTRR